MSELSKQDIKEIFVEILEPFVKAVQDDFRKVNEWLTNIETKNGGGYKKVGLWQKGDYDKTKWLISGWKKIPAKYLLN